MTVGTPGVNKPELADYLVNRLSGKRSVIYDVTTREIPERSLLCLKRNVDEQGAWVPGKEFIAILRGDHSRRWTGEKARCSPSTGVR